MTRYRLIATPLWLAAIFLVSCERDAPSHVRVIDPPPAADSEGSVGLDVAGAVKNGIALAAVLASPAPTSGKSVCPKDMLLVEGNYCPEVVHDCLGYLDPPGRYEHFRCAEYGKPHCASKERRRMRFCMDRDEYAPEGATLPANRKSWTNAKQTCEGLGKRVCMQSEWHFACEGEEMRPYPYGFKRDPSACNADNVAILSESGQLKDLRAPSDAYPRCVSPFGVRNMSGNLEEFVTIDGTNPPKPAMKGAYWQPSRNHCRAAQTAHDEFYSGIETGFRCCADAPKDN